MAGSYPFATALVTGASSGIGAEIARQLAGRGVRTVVVARRADRLAALAHEFDVVEPLPADLLSSDGLAAVEDRIRADGERAIDLVVNNAGFGTSGLFHELDRDRLDDEIALNVRALTRLAHTALEVMVPRRRGWLLNVSSVASFQPAPRLAVYTATKAYITNLTESLHGELVGTGVEVSALCPGLTRTEFQSVSRTDTYQSKFPEFLWTDVADVAAAGIDGVIANKPIVIPGAFYKTMVAASSAAPNWLTRTASRMVQRR